MSDRANKQGRARASDKRPPTQAADQAVEGSNPQSLSPQPADSVLGGSSPLDPKSVLQLQSLIGNQAVQRVLKQNKANYSDPATPMPSSFPVQQLQAADETEMGVAIPRPDSLFHTLPPPSPPDKPESSGIPTKQGGSQTRHIQRDTPDAGAPATAVVPPATEGADTGEAKLSPEAARQLLYATTTLRRVEPLSAGNQQLLERAIPGATLFVEIQERDQKRQELQQCKDELVRITPEHGMPESGGPLENRIKDLSRQIESLTPEIERMNRSIRAQLGALRLTDESQLVQLVSEEFPRLFVERAKKIAIAELDQNKELAEREKQRYSQSGGKPEDRQGLRQAAQDIFHRQTQLDQLSDQLQAAQDDVSRQMPSAGTPDPSALPSSYYDVQHLRPKLEQQRTELQQRWDRYRVQYPVLQQDVDIEKIATGNNEAVDDEINSPIDKVLENIEETKENIKSGHLKIWNLRNIVDMTAQDLGVASNPTLMQVVGQHIQQEQTDEAILKIAVAALAVTAFIVATVATGGLALAAGGVALAAGGYQAYQSAQDYAAESSASNVALDPRIADISQKEPELFWLVLDIAGVVLDAVQVVKLFNEMRVVARALKETGELGEFARVARSVLPPDVAKRVIVNASRQAGVSKSVSKTIEAVGKAFRQADMAEVTSHIEKIAGKGFARVIERLQADGSFHPLTEEALEAVLGNRRASRLITQEQILTAAGFYDPRTGHMFVRPGTSLSEMSSTVIHESVHYLQGSATGRAVSGFLAEFEAYAAQRHFLQRLARDAGPDAIPDAWRWLFEASDDAIAAHISLHYGYTIPGNIDGAQAVLDVIRRIGQFR